MPARSAGAPPGAVGPTRRDLRRFGLVLSVTVIVAFAGIPFWRRQAIIGWPWLIAVVLSVAALIAPSTLSWPYRGWSRLGEALGWLNTRVLLSLLYTVVIVPIGLGMRLFGRDSMRRKFEPAADSYRVASKPRPPSHLEQPF